MEEDLLTGCLPNPGGNVDRDGGSSGCFFLDYVGEVLLSINQDGLSWNCLDSSDFEGTTCLGIRNLENCKNEIRFSDIYAVEFANYGFMHSPKSSLGHAKECFRDPLLNAREMYRFTVHGFQSSPKEPCLWKLASFTFGHMDLQMCQSWMDQLNYSLIKEVERPRNLLVFVHPRSGKGNGSKVWENVSKIFIRAKVNTKVIVTERAGHAFDVMTSIQDKELHLYDGIIAVGGDGFFNEVLNGYLLSRLKVPLPQGPSDSFNSAQSRGNSSISDSGDVIHEIDQKEHYPLLPDSVEEVMNFGTGNGSCEARTEDSNHPFSGERPRFGLIPAGSTDAIVICTTGARDPVTSALHIILGRKLFLDAMQVVRWKTTPTSTIEPYIRYAASFAGYGFYGDVISESEKYRWMGPKRYDYVGTKIFLKHRSYEAEVMYEEAESENGKASPHTLNKPWPFRNTTRSEKILCRANCSICNSKIDGNSGRTTPSSCPEKTRWCKTKGRFLSIGAAVMSNRNERAPDGLVVDAHLSDGFLHLILIKDCSRPKYLWHLTELAKRGGEPLNFEFVEYHKTRAFTFTSVGEESVWNLDGEILKAHHLSAQVLRGLIPLFASGPEVISVEVVLMETSETAREPCPDRILDDIGGGFGIGAIGGSAFHFIKGIYNSPKGSRFFGGMQAANMNALRLGGNFAVWGGLFSTFDCTMVYLRQKEDPWNSIISGAATSGFLSIRRGLGPASRAAVFGGCFLALFEGALIMMNKAEAQTQNIMAEESMIQQMGQMQNQAESSNQNTASTSSSWFGGLFGKKNEEVQAGDGSKTKVLESFDAPPAPSFEYK